MMRKIFAAILAVLAFSSAAYAQPVSGGGGGGATAIVGPAPLALRQVATGSSIPTYRDTSPASFLCRSPSYITSDVSSLQLELPNFMIDTTAGFAEVGPTGSATVDFAAWVEWPKGQMRQMTFANGSATTGTAANAGVATTDLTPLGVTIPKGSQVWFWVRGIGTGAGRVLYTAGSNNSTNQGGEGCVFSGVTGSTVPITGISFGSSGIASTTGFRPSAVRAYTTQRSYFVPGDSRSAVGLGDTRSGGRDDVGEINRGLGVERVPYISYGNAGESVASILTLSAGQRTNFVRLANESTDVIVQLGFNDANGGASLATMQANYTALKALTAGTQRFWLTTKPPGSASTDSWATTANQTTNANNAGRVSLNGWIRTSPSGYAGYFEVADACESARDSGLWKVTGTAFGWTVDGVHASVTCYEYIRDGGYLKVGN